MCPVVLSESDGSGILAQISERNLDTGFYFGHESVLHWKLALLLAADILDDPGVKPVHPLSTRGLGADFMMARLWTRFSPFEE